MFSILRSDLVNPFEPMGEELKLELDKTITLVLIEKKTDILLLNPEQPVTAQVVVEEDCILCGAPWVDSILEKVNLTGKIQWHAIEGSMLLAGSKVCTIQGTVQDIVGKEKIILDLLSLFSSIARQTYTYANLISNTNSLLYYNYLTIPGLSFAQQYAVRAGGGHGDLTFGDEELLISNKHVKILGGVSAALKQAFVKYSIDCIKIEVTSIKELMEAMELGIKQVRLCFFTLEQIAKAQELVKGQVILEVYGGVYQGNIQQIAEMGIPRIIIGDFDKKISIVRYSLSYIES